MLVLATLVVVLARATTAGTERSFFVGFTEDLPKEIGAKAGAPAAKLGARAFRVTLMWEPGQTRLRTADAAKLGRAVRGTRGLRLVLAVYAWPGSGGAPRDAATRDQFCAYAANALRRFPAIRDVVVWNEPNKSLFWSPQLTDDAANSAPIAYEALLARCYDVLHRAQPRVNVIGLALSSTGNDDARSHSPGNFIRIVGEAYRASGRRRPLFDTVGFHPYGLDARERPWRRHVASKTIAIGDWNKLMFNLWSAFRGTKQAIPGERGVSIWYMEYGVETQVDPRRRRAYHERERTAVLPDAAGGDPDGPAPPDTSPAPDQATQVLDAVRLAACQPYVGAIFNFLLRDEPTLAGWQSGAFWADGSPKRSLPSFREAIAEVNAGRVDCDRLKGGRPSADFRPPPPPSSLAGSEGADGVRLTWQASTDGSGIDGYVVYRNGACIGRTRETSLIAEPPRFSSSFEVRAVDRAGNLGSPSQPLTIVGWGRRP